MTEIEKRIIDGLECILNMRTDKKYISKVLKGIDPEQKEILLDTFSTGFMLASVNAFGKMKNSSYEQLVKEERISSIDRLKILIMYMKNVADD